MKVVILLTLLTTLPVICHSYSTGPPLPACQSMTPGHGVPPQTSAAPFSITTSSDNYNRGDNIRVTVTATASTMPFKGFFIQARNASSEEAIGQFFLDVDPEIELLYCPAGNSIGNAVGHKSPAVEKTTKTFIWNNRLGSDVYFKGTFVHNFTTFWVDVRSRDVRDNDATDGGANLKCDMIALLFLFIATEIA